MRLRFYLACGLGAALAALACNALTGVGDLSPCEGVDCNNLGASSSSGDGLPDRDGGSDDDAALPATCTAADKPRCAGNAAAHCVGGKFETTECAERCLDGECTSFPSCKSSDAGAGCGPDGGTGSCCETIAVPGGTYNRYNDATKAAEVSPFRLDKLEVTVGRFRAFVEAGGGTTAQPPAAGAGAHPKIANSGWNPEWGNLAAKLLPKDRAELENQLGGGTWTAMPGGNELKPITNVTWFVAFSFCIWDGGRLPTNAEWGFASVGGDQQRVYPWSDPPATTTIDTSFAAYNCAVDPPSYNCVTPPPICSVGGQQPCIDADCAALMGTCNAQAPVCTGCAAVPVDIANVGRFPKGVGRWGHLDLAGNVDEWVLDATGNRSSIVLPSPCKDCLEIVPSSPGGAAAGTQDDTWMIIRGGNWNSKATTELINSNTTSSGAAYNDRSTEIGFRCARN